MAGVRNLRAPSDHASSPSLVADSGKLPNLFHDDHQVLDEMRKSEFGDWRPPSRALEIAIYKAWYPITESVLHQVFDRFGVVEDVYVREGLNCIEAHVLFQSKHQAAEAFSNVHGRNIYDGCCHMEIKWGLFQEAEVPEPRAQEVVVLEPRAPEPCTKLESPTPPTGDAPTASASSTTTSPPSTTCPRLTSPPLPLKGAPVAAPSTTSTDSWRSPATAGCARPRRGAAPTSGCRVGRVRQRPRATPGLRPPAPGSCNRFGRARLRQSVPKLRPSRRGHIRVRKAGVLAPVAARGGATSARARAPRRCRVHPRREPQEAGSFPPEQGWRTHAGATAASARARKARRRRELHEAGPRPPEPADTSASVDAKQARQRWGLREPRPRLRFAPLQLPPSSLESRPCAGRALPPPTLTTSSAASAASTCSPPPDATVPSLVAVSSKCSNPSNSAQKMLDVMPFQRFVLVRSAPDTVVSKLELGDALYSPWNSNIFLQFCFYGTGMILLDGKFGVLESNDTEAFKLPERKLELGYSLYSFMGLFRLGAEVFQNVQKYSQDQKMSGVLATGLLVIVIQNIHSFCTICIQMPLQILWPPSVFAWSSELENADWHDLDGTAYELNTGVQVLVWSEICKHNEDDASNFDPLQAAQGVYFFRFQCNQKILHIPLCNILAWVGGGLHQKQHDNRTKICCYILRVVEKSFELLEVGSSELRCVWQSKDVIQDPLQMSQAPPLNTSFECAILLMICFAFNKNWQIKLLSWGEACKVLGDLPEPSSAMPWPPLRQAYNTLLSETTWQCFNFQQLFSCGWTLLQQRPPWQLFSLVCQETHWPLPVWAWISKWGNTDQHYIDVARFTLLVDTKLIQKIIHFAEVLQTEQKFRPNTHSYILRCYAFMSKLFLSRTNNSQCCSLFELLQDVQQFSHFNLFTLADQVTGIMCVKVPCSQVQLSISVEDFQSYACSDDKEVINCVATNCWIDLAVDIPDLVYVLPPAFLSKTKVKLSKSSKDLQVVQIAEKSYPSAHITIQEVNKRIAGILEEASEECKSAREKLWDPGGFQQRLEGKPHFKRWGMSWTGPLAGPSFAQWAGQERKAINNR